MTFYLLIIMGILFAYPESCSSNFYDLDVEQLTLEEKIGQMLMVSFHGSSLNEDAIKLITQVHVGGFIYYRFANELTSPELVRNLSIQLQQTAQARRSHIPLIISVDQEGGNVNRLTQGFTLFPAQAVLGTINDTTLTEQTAYTIGEQLRSVGITMNMAPVADINSNPQNPIIGSRAFGATPELVSQHVAAALRGYLKARIIASPKHFPGHGDTSTDSHTTLPIITKSIQQLETHELLPFIAARHAPAIMTAHILIPGYDANNCATMSPTIINNILRKHIGYTGVIITDSLLMHGALHNKNIGQAAIASIQAGCDIILLGGRLLTGTTQHEITTDEIIDVYRSLIQAVRNEEISIAQINASVTRILLLKKQYQVGLIPDLTSAQLHEKTDGSAPQLIANTIEKRHNRLQAHANK